MIMCKHVSHMPKWVRASAMDNPWSERIRQIEETLSLLRRAEPRNQPSVEDIARLHELLARDEHGCGHEDTARAEEERAP